jgi:hypothetical protein
MGAAKSGGQEVRIGEVSVKCAEKTGFPGFGFFRHGGNRVLRGRRWLPKEEECNSQDHRINRWQQVYTELRSGSPKCKSRVKVGVRVAR